MTPPKRNSFEEARRKLGEAASVLDGMHRLNGEEAAPVASALSASESVRREALSAARDDLRRMAAELETARARSATLLSEVDRLREELAARPTAHDLLEAKTAGESNAARRAAEMTEQVVGLKERVALLSAEHVRLEAVRRKAEEFGANAESSRRSLEEALRRDLRAAHSALDRAAAESGIRDAKAVTEIAEMRKRLDHALGRLQREDREDSTRKQKSAEESSLRGDLEASSTMVAAVRRELEEQRAVALGLRRELEEQRAVALGLRRELEEQRAVALGLRRELEEQRAVARGRESALELRAQDIERRLSEAVSSVISSEEGAEEIDELYPSMEYALEPGWARLIRLVKPPLQAAYAHLRRLSSGPLSAGQRAMVRLTGSSLSSAADSLATIELALSDAPATNETAPLLPVLEGALAAWEGVFRRRAIILTREFERIASDAPHDPEQLRLALHHVLRNAVEALPRGSTLRVHVGKSAQDGIKFEFRDDGPGYSPAWLERQFEPFALPRTGHAGLGLAAVQRALRRWGGDASVANAAEGHGACLTLTFAPASEHPGSKLT